MTPLRRWAVVAVAALGVVAVPVVPRLLPVADRDVSAPVLLDRVLASGDRSWSGYAETRGAVQLPVGEDLGEVGELLAGRTRLRAWWQDEYAWRVDRLLVSGESDLVHDGPTTLAYDYEDARAERTRDPEVRLPRASDLLPPVLGRSLLQDAGAADVVRLASRRVAGVDAAGLRYRPGGGRSMIEHVDVWADPASGVPLRVEVLAVGSGEPDAVTAFAEYDDARPADEVVAFRPAPGLEVEEGDILDIADAAGRYAPFVVPDVLAGLDLTSAGGSAVGVYGVGATRFIAVPLRDQEAGPLRDQLAVAPAAVVAAERTSVTDGPLTVLLTGGPGSGGWLVAGSVTPDTLADAARTLVRLPFVERDR